MWPYLLGRHYESRFSCAAAFNIVQNFAQENGTWVKTGKQFKKNDHNPENFSLQTQISKRLQISQLNLHRRTTMRC